MRASCVAGVLTLLITTAHSHYFFNQLTVNGKKGAVFEHIRHNSNYNSPIVDLASNDLRCNAGGADGSNTATATVAAGSAVTWGTDTKVYHQGPVSMYMTKVPSAKEADGSTKWFKIEDIGPKFSGQTGDWAATQQQSFQVTIPKCIPAGEYLLRAQQLAIHNPGGDSQFYIACAQLKVTGGGKSIPPDNQLVKIPGAFKKTDPGYKVNIYNNFKEYKVPGPSVWSC